MLFQIINWALKTLGLSQEYIDYIYMFSILKYFDCQAHLQYMNSIDGFPRFTTTYIIFYVLFFMLSHYIQVYWIFQAYKF